jgi:FtsP/CotA-like multicopper oxidase with cupredoxin domain
MNRNEEQPKQRIDRRDFLRLGGGAALVALTAGAGISRALRPQGTVEAAPSFAPPTTVETMRLVATDGFFSFPGRRSTDPGPLATPDDGRIFGFGFRAVAPNEINGNKGPGRIDKLIQKYKGKVSWPAPILPINKDTQTFIVLTNLGLAVRPDLDDSHTIHWHGFRNPNSVFDGVPEVSVAVPPERDFPYLFVPRDSGTYMYHCHFEDVEHVQMGMDGVVYIKSLTPGYAYDLPNGDPALDTAFDRQFSFMLNEIDTHPHDNLVNIQEFVWSNYKANHWVMNGRSYPDTVMRDQELPSSDFDLGDGLYSQPVSSLMQCKPGDRVLMRIASLGYEQHAMQLLGIPMHVVGQDASYLGANAYDTHTIYLGPGEARDVIFTAPPYQPGSAMTDAVGDYNRYWFRNRSAHRLINPGVSGLGGMLTEVRVYGPATNLGPQTGPNATF